jgi:hypothetical protein
MLLEKQADPSGCGATEMRAGCSRALFAMRWERILWRRSRQRGIMPVVQRVELGWDP